jgi:hypothetical protein
LLQGEASSSSSAVYVCELCGQEGHLNAKPKQCANYKLTLNDKLQQDFGGSMEKFTRKVYLKSVLRPLHKAIFTEKVIKLSEFIRNVTFRAQIFVSNNIIHNQDSPSLISITEQNFWCSISQLIMGQKVTNKKYLSNEIVYLFDEFQQMYPKILHTLKDNKLTGYSDSLTAACVTIATTYLNHIVENFQNRILYFIQKKLRDIYKKEEEVKTLYKFTQSST